MAREVWASTFVGGVRKNFHENLSMKLNCYSNDFRNNWKKTFNKFIPGLK